MNTPQQKERSERRKALRTMGYVAALMVEGGREAAAGGGGGSPEPNGPPGFVQISSQHSFADTRARLESLLTAAGVTIFARIEFSEDAARAGLSMRPEVLLIFGNPKGGTPLMVAQPTAGLDLPLKALIWEDSAGRTWAAYNDPVYIVRRHALPPAMAANLAAAVTLIERACQA